MRGVTFVEPERVRVESVDDPTIVDPGDAIVAVSAAGVCGSDLHVFHGRETGIDAGTVMGHEFVGEVVEIGADVRTLRRGTRVLSPFTTSCGDCAPCRGGLSARCVRSRLFGWVERGVGLEGAQAEFVRVPDADGTLVAAPPGLHDDVALLLGDILATGYYCALRAEVDARGTFVVVGCGPVGLLAIASARRLGAERIFAIDRVAERLDAARGFGAEPIDAGSDDPIERVRAATDGAGADGVLEAVGSPEAHRLGIDLLRPGGTLSVVGVHNEPGFSFSPSEAYDRNLTYRIGRCPVRSLIPRLIPFALEEGDRLRSVISHRLPLDEGAEAYRIFANRLDGCTKAVLEP